MPLPPMTPVDSSSLAAVGFDAAVNELTVAFQNGTVYRYFQVPSSVHRALLSAPSIGRTFNETVRDRFPSLRLRGEESP
jgi:KTSC domain